LLLTFKVIPLRSNADPFLSPLPLLQQNQTVSITTTSESLLLAIPQLYKLSAYPIVIHIFLVGNPTPDYSIITSLRQTGFAILQSASLQEVQDIALVSHSLALASGKGVIHFTEASQSDAPIRHESTEIIRSLLDVRMAYDGEFTPFLSHSQYRRDNEDQAASIDVSSTAATDVGSMLKRNQNGNSHGISNGNGAIELDGNGVTASSTASVSSSETSTTRSNITHLTSAIAEEIFQRHGQLTGREYHNLDYFGSPDSESAIVFFGSHSEQVRQLLAEAMPTDRYHGVGLVVIRLYRPWLSSVFWNAVPKQLTKIAVVEQLQHRPMKWGPVFMDVLSSAARTPAQTVVSFHLGHLNEESLPNALTQIATNMNSDVPQQNIAIGSPVSPPFPEKLELPPLENAYVKILRQLFADRLHILNITEFSTSLVPTEISSAPEFLFGAYTARMERRKLLMSDLLTATRSGQLGPSDLNELVSRWLHDSANGTSTDDTLAASIVDHLRQQQNPLSQKLLSDPWFFRHEVPWIIGSEAWAYDFGMSGLHHVLSAGKNVNMLIIDSQPYSTKTQQNLENRKKDIGLYAMNFGNSYVASVAVYSSYTQVMHAMVEAENFDGPSIVLAYLPYTSELDSPVQLLQDTKMAVDSGYWPLYRWAPATKSGVDPVFQLDSERVKKELKAFIDRENHLTHLVRGKVALSPSVSHSHGSELKRLRKVKAKEAMEKLMDGLSGPPVTILYASDGGNAENIAKRIGRRGKARGLKAKILAMDDFPVEELSNEINLIFCTSTAGQGEFPQNGREMWDSLKSGTDIDLSRVAYAVMALGDSHYWPRKEDKLYYNKPGKDIDARLEALGGKRLTAIGLGDDQDPDGYETGYNIWEPELWKALGADEVDADFEEPRPLTNEDIKISSNFLRGTIAEGLADSSTGAIAESDAQLTKFHGTYMQDDRDLRDERKSQGLEPAYSFMVRVRMSAGVCQPEQWIAMDEISDKWGNETFKLVSCPYIANC
jgi:sulfite reductase (NADPH) hemoprotein beta-component